MKKNSVVFLLIFGLLWPNGVTAATTDIEAYFWSSEIPAVTSTSKTSVKINRAPGTVYSFTGDELVERGIVTLEDLFREIPGAQADLQRQNHMGIWFRGVQGRYNDKVLLLVDGIPRRDYWYGNFTLDEMFPVDRIANIEIIVGPGSVLYGANAFGGVINITTKQGVTDAAVAYGTNEHAGVVANLNFGRWASLFAQYDDVANGFRPQFGRDGKPRLYPQDQNRQLSSFAAAVTPVEGLTVRAERLKYESPFAYSKQDRSSVMTREVGLGSVSFTKGAPETLKVDAQLYYSNNPFRDITEKGTASLAVTSTEIETRDTSYGGAETYLTKKLAAHTMLMGVSYTFDKLSPTARLETFNHATLVFRQYALGAYAGETNENIAAYLQDIWAMGTHTDLTLGVRYDNIERFKNQINGRAGLVYVSDDNLSLKALFGTSFRAPSNREYQSLKNGVVAYDPSIQPEHMQTFELSAGKSYDTSKMLATLFYNRYRDYITDKTVAGIDEVFYNAGRRTMRGVELSGAILLFDRLRLTPGWTYTKAEDETGAPLHSIAKSTGYLDAGISIGKKLSLGVTGIFIGSRDVAANYQTTSTAKNKDLKNGYDSYNARASYEIFSGTTLQVTGRNITDRRYYNPHFGPASDYDMEWPGAEWKVALRTKF